MQNDYTHIAIVLDRSGSMASVQDDTIGGFNTFLAEQQSQPGHATLTLIQFDDQYEVWNDFAPIRDVPVLTRKTFVPRGSTALLDAMGRAIDETGQRLAQMPEAARPGKILVVTLTDGAENASQNFNYGQIQAKITHQREKYGWEFVFIGANQDAIATGANVGIPSSHAITYASTSAGQRDIMGKLSKNVSRKRAEAQARSMPAGAAPAPAQESEFFTKEDRETLPDLKPQSK